MTLLASLNRFLNARRAQATERAAARDERRAEARARAYQFHGLEPLEPRMLMSTTIPSGFVPIETISVSSLSNQVTYSSASLEAGNDYFVEVSGQYLIRDKNGNGVRNAATDRLGDGEFFQASPSIDNEIWLDSDTGTPGEGGLEIGIGTPEDVDLLAYTPGSSPTINPKAAPGWQSDSIYGLELNNIAAATDMRLAMVIPDPFYNDNFGGLTVKLYEAVILESLTLDPLGDSAGDPVASINEPQAEPLVVLAGETMDFFPSLTGGYPALDAGMIRWDALYNGGLLSSGAFNDSDVSTIVLENIGDYTITAYVDSNDNDTRDSGEQNLSVAVSAVVVDLDVDSDNENGYDLTTASRTDAEDEMEAEETDGDDNPLPGKVILINNGDRDFDGVPDYLDGFNADGVVSVDDAPPTVEQGHRFAQVVIDLPEGIDLDKARLQIDYAAATPAATIGAGDLRLWMKDANEGRGKANVTEDNGDFVAARTNDQFYSGGDFDTLGFSETDLSQLFYVEGIASSDALGDKTITIRIDPDGDGPAGYFITDMVRLTVLGVDADVDSLNNNGFELPAASRTSQEDAIEIKLMETVDKRFTGKILSVNNSDFDGDGIVDYLDGYNADGTAGNSDDTPPTLAQGQDFAQLALTIPTPIDLQKARLQILYDGSAPGATLNDGSLRLWKKDGNQVRGGANFTGEAGDYVAPTVGASYYSGADLQKLGFSGSVRTQNLFLEALRPSTESGDKVVEFRIDPDGDGPIGFLATDLVRLTNMGIDLDIDSLNNSGFDLTLASRTAEEDGIEAQVANADNKKLVGKVILVNEGDLDGDGVLDYLDGYNADGTVGNADDAPPSATQGQNFAEVAISLPSLIDLSTARLQIVYDGSAPGAALNDGALRLWTKDGNQARAGANFTETSGDYVAPRSGTAFYSGDELTKLGFSPTARTRNLFIEGIRPSADASDKTIGVRVDPDGDGPIGYLATDFVRLTSIRVDLDIDHNGSLNDRLDRTVNYLPGYGPSATDPAVREQKVSTGTTFNTKQYATDSTTGERGQRMDLLVQGLGTGTVIDKIDFEIVNTVTHIPGYAGNASDGAIEGGSKDDDFSFLWDKDQLTATGIMAAGLTSVPLFAKDYGGWADLNVTATIGGNTFLLRQFDVVNDTDGDQIADLWERAEVERWNTQYAPATAAAGLGFFDETSDSELEDPDGTTDALGFVDLAAGAPAGATDGKHSTAGDGREALDEYRGYILDGGGHDSNGANSHNGGHARLTAVVKELLVEVDAMPTAVPASPGVAAVSGVTGMPARAGIAAWIDAVAVGMSQATDGAGFQMYYVLEDLATGHQVDFPSKPDAKLYLDGEHDLASFTHLQLVDELGAWGSGGQAWGDHQTMVGIDWLSARHGGFWGAGLPGGNPSFDEFVVSYISHELHHTYAWNAPGPGAHVDDTDGDGSDDQASDFEYLLYNYNGAPVSYNWNDYAQLKYGAGTTRYITIR